MRIGAGLHGGRVCTNEAVKSFSINVSQLLKLCVCFVPQVASAIGCRCFIAIPDDAAIEKAQLLTALGEGWGKGLELKRDMGGCIGAGWRVAMQHLQLQHQIRGMGGASVVQSELACPAKTRLWRQKCLNALCF
jgi:hypothetical protein